MNIEKVDIRYLAGLFEGEGSAYIMYNKKNTSSQARISIAMTDLVPVTAFQEYFDLGKIRLHSDKRKNRNRVYEWYAYNNDAANAAIELLPFILSERKRGALQCVIDFRKTMSVRGIKVERCVKSHRQWLYKKCRLYNARGEERAILPRQDKFESNNASIMEKQLAFL